MQDYSQAYHFVSAIAGDPATAVMDWRALSDYDAAADGVARRGTLLEWWQWLCQMNDANYGIFCTIASMDGNGRHLVNVDYLRANYIDNDGPDAPQQAERARNAYPAPTLAVQSSPNKFHTYWCTDFYRGNDRFQLLQRKLRQSFNSDKAVIDACRVMRLPGTLNTKYSDARSPKYTGVAAHLVTMEALPGWGTRTTVEALEQALANVNIIEGGEGTRHALGNPDLAAPSLDWVKYAMALTDPNEMDRAEWLGFSAALKQSAWNHADPETIHKMWSDWCARYAKNDPSENDKLWNSITTTEIGWSSVLKKAPGLHAQMTLGGIDRTSHIPNANFSGGPETPPMPVNNAPMLDCKGEFLSHLEQKEWFKDVYYVSNLGRMLDRDDRFLDTGKFNAKFGGKYFIISNDGKKTDEAWKAATRSTLWRVPQVDHVRFMPAKPHHAIIPDALGRKGINLYRPIIPVRIDGDVSPFLNHIGALLPDVGDQRILLDYLAHNVQYPGYKIPWAPVIQSLEGAGKGLMKLLMGYAMGEPYVYFPTASELTNSGAQFNHWMRYKTFIVCDEIKVDDRMDLIEVLKPMLSEERIEVQSKGVDQDLEDNFSNWLFFSNWKNAIPINKNGRRFAIMYSPLQTVADLQARGMDDYYFKCLYDWMKGDNGYPLGKAIVTDYLMKYPIERGAIPMRAPNTSSTSEALLVSQSPIERTLVEAIEDNLQGFRGGWVSSVALQKRLTASGAVGRRVAPQTLSQVIEGMGYVACGRAPRMYISESPDMRADLFHFGARADVEGYGPAQGY